MIRFQNVSKEYANGVRGLENISLTLEKGEFVAIIGKSGAGKSTLLRTINRLESITTGDIFFEERSLKTANKRELKKIRRQIGLISQSFNLVKRSTVQQNVLSGRLGYYGTVKSILGLFEREDYQRTVATLQKLGLADKLHSRSDQLSGGQQQRVSIARALVQQATVILADEPVAALDPMTAEGVMQDLKRVNEEENVTIVVNLHSLPLARKYAHRILALKDGCLVYDGPVAGLTTSVLQTIYGPEFVSEDQREGDVHGEAAAEGHGSL